MLDELKQYIRSYVPGRLRLRHPGLKGIDADTEKLIVETVTSASGITGCTINPEVGSLLLTWDRHALTEEDLLGYLSFWAAFIPGDALGETMAEASAEDADETDEAAQPCAPVAAKIVEGKAAGKELAASAIANAKVYTDAGLDVLRRPSAERLGAARLVHQRHQNAQHHQKDQNAHVAAVRKLGHHAAVLIEEQGVDGQLQIAVGIQQCTGCDAHQQRGVHLLGVQRQHNGDHRRQQRKDGAVHRTGIGGRVRDLAGRCRCAPQQQGKHQQSCEP